MPSPQAFRAAFGLVPAQRFAGAVVEEVHVGHVAVTHHQRYRFPWRASLSLPPELDAAARPLLARITELRNIVGLVDDNAVETR